MDTDERQVRFVIGLGNPEPRYRRTRHNVGFMVLAELRGRHDFGRGRSRFHARLWSGAIGPCRVTLAAPQTYMNRSGLAAAEIAAFYKVRPAELLVVMDEMALPLGRLRARARGSAGGHKGLGDVLAAVGTEELPRLRVGIGQHRERMEAVDYVLSEFDAEEKGAMDVAIRRAADAVEDWATKGITYVMDHYNREGPDEQGGKGTQ